MWSCTNRRWASTASRGISPVGLRGHEVIAGTRMIDPPRCILVMPPKAGNHDLSLSQKTTSWIPAFGGMTRVGIAEESIVWRLGIRPGQVALRPVERGVKLPTHRSGSRRVVGSAVRFGRGRGGQGQHGLDATLVTERIRWDSGPRTRGHTACSPLLRNFPGREPVSTYPVSAPVPAVSAHATTARQPAQAVAPGGGRVIQFGNDIVPACVGLTVILVKKGPPASWSRWSRGWRSCGRRPTGSVSISSPSTRRG